MERLKRRNFEAELRGLCKARGLKLDKESRRRNHVAFTFRDARDETHVTIVLSFAHDDELSPTVQRGALGYLSRLSAEVVIAETVKEILEQIF